MDLTAEAIAKKMGVSVGQVNEWVADGRFSIKTPGSQEEQTVHHFNHDPGAFIVNSQKYLLPMVEHQRQMERVMQPVRPMSTSTPRTRRSRRSIPEGALAEKQGGLSGFFHWFFMLD